MMKMIFSSCSLQLFARPKEPPVSSEIDEARQLLDGQLVNRAFPQSPATEADGQEARKSTGAGLLLAVIDTRVQESTLYYGLCYAYTQIKLVQTSVQFQFSERVRVSVAQSRSHPRPSCRHPPPVPSRRGWSSPPPTSHTHAEWGTRNGMQTTALQVNALVDSFTLTQSRYLLVPALGPLPPCSQQCQR